MATFFARYEKALRRVATPVVTDGRLQGSAPVEVADLTNPGDKLSAPAPFELFGPGDVERLGAGAIRRRFPAPGTSDAEETKLALVELSANDLPWRYTPTSASAGELRPWLVLVVGRRAPDEIVVRPDGLVTIGPATQSLHPLRESWQWAHVHQVDGKEIARIVCPLNLQADTELVACLVPGFTAAGADAWTGGVAVTLDCYDRWSFRTGPQGDFPELAAKLHKADLAAIEAGGGRPFGRAQVTYTFRTGGVPDVVLDAAGALRLPPDPGGRPDPADDEPDPLVSDEVAKLTRRIVTDDGRGVVNAPRYDGSFIPADELQAFPPGTWVVQLGSDPRVRGAAGLGAWAAIEWQDRIGDAAAAKAGDLQTAHDRIRHVALGIEASRSLWRRRMPPLPADPGADPDADERAAIERLAVLAPVLGRLPTDSHKTVLDRVTGTTPQLGRALLSSAARRALRPGPARTALAGEGAGRFGPVLRAANDCPADVDDPADIRGRDDADVGDQTVKEAVWEAAGGSEELFNLIMERLGESPRPLLLVAALRALAPGRDGRPDPDAIERFLHGEFSDDDLSLSHFPGWIDEVAPKEPCRPVNLGGLATAVAGAIDPTVARPPAVNRVLATLPGFTHIGPVEIEPELDLPLWSFLTERSPDWMLPGAGDLEEHGVVGLATNPAFVQALLAGANTQATGELRWRNIPLATRFSPMRRFWQRPSGALDIVPIKGWATDRHLGDRALSPGGRGAEAVVAFRTPLFRRYPATVVYLYPAAGNFQPPPDDTALDPPPARKDPTFTGTIGDDITFFGFDVDPAALASHWVVLEEPPAGYRFAHKDNVPPPFPGLPDTNSANYAYNRFALPVRVLIGPLL